MDETQLAAKLEAGQLRVAIVGFGYIGTCIGAVLADRGLQVVGLDTRAKVADEIRRGTTSINEPGLRDLVRRCVARGTLTATTSDDVLRDADVVVVTVGTPLGADLEPDVSHIEAAARSVARHLRSGQIIVLKSTIPPWTTERVVKPILDGAGLSEGSYALAFCPERLAEGRALEEFLSIPVVVGGVDERSTRIVAELWRRVLGVPAIEVASPRAAEMTKLADNLWIDLNIALANEIAKLCDKLDCDALEVIDAANTLPKVNYNVNILVPSMGVGGYCLTKDPWFVHHLGKKYGLDIKTPVVSRTVNDGMPRYTFELLRAALEARGRPIERARVAVLGIAFKSNTGDCRFTPTKGTIELLEESRCELAICDPWVSEDDARTVTTRPLVPTVEEAINGADAVAFLTGHTEFKSFPIDRLAALVSPGAVVLDGRIFFTKDQIRAIRAHGLVYKGVGR